MIYFRTQTLTSPSLPPPQFALCHIPYNNHRISFLLGPLSQNVSSFEDWRASLRKLWLRHTSSCLMSSRELGGFCGICYVLPRLTPLQRKTLGRMRFHSLRLCRWGCKCLGEDVNRQWGNAIFQRPYGRSLSFINTGFISMIIKQKEKKKERKKEKLQQIFKWFRNCFRI